MLQRIIRHQFIPWSVLAILSVSLTSAASFGRVVPIGGHASDIALDEGRGVLYIANYTQGRIDVMTLSDYTVNRSISVATYPGGLAVSPDGRYLVVTHYASSGGGSLTQPGRDAVTVIELANNNAKRTFGLSSGPVGVAFGIDGRALIMTQEDFLMFDPASGSTTVVGSVFNVVSQTLPVPQGEFPPQIIAGALTATADGKHILGIGGITPDTGDKSEYLQFSYNVLTRQITAARAGLASPSLGPRVLSTSRDGSYYMTGWALQGCGVGFLGDCTADGPLLAQWPNAAGALNVGSVAIRSSRSLIYAQISAPPNKTADNSQTVPPNLAVMDADNLTVRERIQLSENLAGRSVFNSDETVLYSISDSGVTVFPMSELDRAPRVMASLQDVVFRGNFCSIGPISQEIDVVDPSGNAVPFQICQANSTSCLPQGVTVSPSSGLTPARVKISIDPTVMGSLIGTKSFQFEIRSAAAVNMPPPPVGRVESYTANVRNRFRVLINNREPQYRGAFFNTPGKLVDVLADSARNRFYVIRQDTNEVLVFDSNSYSLITTLRTGNTPTQLAITFDRKYLLVANDNSQIANRFDLDSLQAMQPIVFPRGHYPRSIAASGRAILAASRVAGPINTIDVIDLNTSTASTLSSLGPYKNDIHVGTTLAAAPNGATIFAAMPDGRVLLYNANVDSFAISRKDFESLKGGLAASSFGAYMVDQHVLNESLVKVGSFGSAADVTSGFAFVDQEAYSTTVSAAGQGYIQRLTSAAAQSLRTMIVEPPVVGDTEYPFRRTLAPLADRSALIALTTSGFTVLPWNYDAASLPPVLDRLVNAGDLTKPVAPGGLVSIFGSQLNPMTLSSTDVPLPTVLGDSCLTVNGVIVHVTFVSPTQINAQLPFQISGSAELVLRTPGGSSDALRFTISPTAPSVFRSVTPGASGTPALIRDVNNGLVTHSNPIHLNDRITIYLTGLGRTIPEVADGAPGPSNPMAIALVPTTVSLGGAPLFVGFTGLTPGLVGVYQINATVPFKGVPTGFDIPLTITQGGASTTLLVRVVN